MPDSIHILIVDDDQVIRDLLAEGLSGSGYRCETACNGAESLRKLRASSFDLVVSDIDMPEMDGVRLLQEIKKTHPDTEIIMLTGVVDVDIAIQSMRLGAYDYLTKPFNLVEVRITVERALEKRALFDPARGPAAGWLHHARRAGTPNGLQSLPAHWRSTWKIWTPRA